MQERVRGRNREQRHGAAKFGAVIQPGIQERDGRIHDGSFERPESQHEHRNLPAIPAFEEQQQRQQHEDQILRLVVNRCPAKRRRHAGVRKPQYRRGARGQRRARQLSHQRSQQKRVRDRRREDNDAERNRIHAKQCVQAVEEQILAPRPNVTVRLGREQDRKKIHEALGRSQMQPSEIVLIEPGVQAAPIEDQQEGGRDERRHALFEPS